MLLGVSSIATAQTFKEGSVRLKGGQEQPGFVGDVRPGSPEGIEFKSANDAEIQIYYADEIEGYTVDKIFYSSYHQNKDRSREWIFAEILVEGELTLIRRNNMYFVRRKGNGEFTHLSHRYRVALIKLTRECPVISAGAGTVTMNRTSLTEFITAFNQCVASKKPNLAGMPRTVSIGFQVGYDYTQATFKANDITKFLSATRQYDKSFVQGGIELSFKSYKVSNMIGLYTGALLNVDSYSGVNQTTNKTQTEVNEYSYSYKELKVPFGIEFSRPRTRKITFHLRGGGVLPKILSFKSEHPYTEISNNSSSTVTYGEPSKMTTYKPSTMWGASFGFDYKLMNSHIRIQAGSYWGKATITAVSAGKTVDVHGSVSSFNLMTTFIF